MYSYCVECLCAQRARVSSGILLFMRCALLPLSLNALVWYQTSQDAAVKKKIKRQNHRWIVKKNRLDARMWLIPRAHTHTHTPTAVGYVPQIMCSKAREERLRVATVCVGMCVNSVRPTVHTGYRTYDNKPHRRRSTTRWLGKKRITTIIMNRSVPYDSPIHIDFHFISIFRWRSLRAEHEIEWCCRACVELVFVLYSTETTMMATATHSIPEQCLALVGGCWHSA